MKIEIIALKDDGEIHEDLPQFVYLHVNVVMNGEVEGSLSGYFTPVGHGFIKDALTNYAAAKAE